MLKYAVTDVCVPISRLPEILIETKKDIQKFGLKTTIVGHVGDGNFHTLMALDVNDANEMRNYKVYVSKLTKHALSIGGTCTGEHGIGLGTQFSKLDHGELYR
jgi:D-lactate dehydrogenase (cytochrome)